MAPRDAPLQFEGIATAAYQEEDAATPKVFTVQYSVDGGAWQAGLPVDGRFDASFEHFGIVLSGLTEGEHSLRVRTVDTAGRVETNIELRRF